MGCKYSSQRIKKGVITLPDYDATATTTLTDEVNINPARLALSKESYSSSYSPLISIPWEAALFDSVVCGVVISFLGIRNTFGLACVCRKLHDEILCYRLFSDFDSVVTTSTDGFKVGHSIEPAHYSSCWLNTPYDKREYTPLSLVQIHHSTPSVISLCLPRLARGTLVVLSCFQHLRHITIGCTGVEGNENVTDSEVESLVVTIGRQLQSLRLIKINTITYKSVVAVTHLCTNLDVLVIYGCRRVAYTYLKSRDHYRINLFPSPNDKPEKVASCNENSVRRKINVLDLRYSVDITDILLQDIMNTYHRINMFLGSNMSEAFYDPLSRSLRIPVTDHITTSQWIAFVNHFQIGASLLYVDDAARENAYSTCVEMVKEWNDWLLYYKLTGAALSESFDTTLSTKTEERCFSGRWPVDSVLLSLPIPIHPYIFG